MTRRNNAVTVPRSLLVAAGLVALSIVFGPIVSAKAQRASAAANVVPLVVRTPHSGFNRLVVSVTICVPNTGHCATIEDVMVDTGSTGLRREGSAMPPGFRLPDVLGQAGKPLAECLRFVHDVAWGPLYRADLHMGGLTAADVPIQIISDGRQPQPDACPRSDVRPTSNGTLGIGPLLVDCRDPCRQGSVNPGVFFNDAGSWVPVSGDVARSDRLPNPVSLFPVHGNGVMFDAPTPPAGGAREVMGTLTFGVGTAANNRLGAARIVRIDDAGHFTTLYGGKAYPDSSIDSGTETYILEDLRLPVCARMPGAFCVDPDRRLDATMVGRDGASAPASFTVGDYEARLASGVGASDTMAVPADPVSRAFVWGAPFFMGRRVSVVFDGKAVKGGDGLIGPFYAVGER